MTPTILSTARCLIEQDDATACMDDGSGNPRVYHSARLALRRAVNGHALNPHGGALNCKHAETALVNQLSERGHDCDFEMSDHLILKGWEQDPERTREDLLALFDETLATERVCKKEVAGEMKGCNARTER